MSLFDLSAVDSKFVTGARAVGSVPGTESVVTEEILGGQVLLTALPVLLLPVRLETRFIDDTSGPQLWVRIYPDQIAVDTHEPELTDAEKTAGQKYWDALWRAGTGDPDAEKIAWRALAGAFGPQRAAWVAFKLTPINIDQRPAAPTPADKDPTPLPVYPDVPGRPESWTRAPLAGGLPDYWTVATYVNGAETHRVTSSEVRPLLAVGMKPNPSLPADPTALQVDEGMRWMVDFTEAIAAGMAVRVPLTQQERLQGFDRVIACGFRTPKQEKNGSELFSRLVDAHHYTDGLAFVPQGTPTNNTPDASSAFSREDPGYETSFAVERQAPLTSAPNCDGRVAAQTLGLPLTLFDHVQYANRTDQLDGYHMGVALWPATLGYFLNQMMADVFTPGQVNIARRYFLSYVRPRGSLPAFRVGNTPYGILPVTSLARWNQFGETPAEQAWVSFLRRAVPIWLQGAAGTPRVGGTNDPDADLAGILGMDASAMAYRGRYVMGDYFIWNLMNFLALPIDGQVQWWQQQALSGRQLLDLFGFNTWDPKVIHTSLEPGSFPVPYPTVQDGPLSETEPLKNDWTMSDNKPGNYIHWLRYAGIDDIRNERYPGPKPPTSLLYRVLRQCMLLEYSNLTFNTLVRVGTLALADTKEVELVNIAANRQTLTPWDALYRPIPGVTAPNQTMANYLETLPPGGDPQFSELDDLRTSFEYLANLPTAELDRLFTETLDVFSHRLDAWVTSLPIALMRLGGKEYGFGFYLGGFGWVENLRPAPAPPLVEGVEQASIQRLDELRRERLERLAISLVQRPARQPAVDNGGFIHAPSLSQAAVAAVLRNGYLTHRQSTNGQLLAIDLSSERVQTALWFLEGVRQGQQLGALLGYRFELALHRNDLDRYIQPFRNRYPLVANKVTQPTGPAESVAATNVVDGQALQADWAKGNLPPGGDWGPDLPGPGGDQDGVAAILRDLDDVMDALGDLSMAESVYQIMRGNPVRAGGLLDAVSRGDYAADPQVIRTPRAGFDLMHRLMVLFLGDLDRAQVWGDGQNPRSSAESQLDAWLSNLLPDPAQVYCRVTYNDAAHQGAHRASLDVTLADLQADPLDVLAMANAADIAQSSELEQRLLYAALANLPNDAVNYTIIFERDPAWSQDRISFPELLVVARALRDLLGNVRPLMPLDLVEPQAAQGSPPVDMHELRARANAALKALKTATDRLDTAVNALRTAPPAQAQAASDEVRNRLIDVSWFSVPGSIPISRKGADAGPQSKLVEQGDAVVKGLRKRYNDALAMNNGLATNATPADVIAVLQKVFDPSLVVLARFAPVNGAVLASAFGDSSTLLAGEKEASVRWLQQLTHVRPAVSRFDAAISLAHILADAEMPDFTLGQLPYKANDRWLALPLIPNAPLPTSGRVSLVAWMSGNYDSSKPHSGLLLDEWPERIPSTITSTGLTFHYEEPKARAPQSLLLAVNPDAETRVWNEDLLLTILNESFDLAKIRTVDLDTIRDVGQILPALYFAFNLALETIATHFADVSRLAARDNVGG